MLELGNLDLGERMERKEEALGGELLFFFFFSHLEKALILTLGP